MMRIRRAGLGLAISAFVCLAALCLLGVPPALAQSAGTGAIAGTVTDPSNRSVPKAAVTLTSLATGQTRTATTGPAGDYKFSLLPPGNYSLKFSATGFKTSTVPSITVNTTETATADQTLQVGAVSESVTVEANVETLQTENSTLGTTITGTQIAALPMANGNYTEILSLSAGTNASVDNATSLGKGTQDISANGVDPGSNNFQMDGVAVNNIANSGSSNDGTIYTGIPIPSPDAIAEFKVQTSTYDASYGRNPGANVNVSTKSGTNQFHGSGFEFFRNSVLNADDFFYDKTSAHPHQVFDQNQFGGTIGGPIKKDKLFFFFSYRGTRSKNAVAPQGGDFGASLFTPPNNDNPVNEIDNFAALGSRGTCPSPAQLGVAPNTPDFSSISENCSAQAVAFANAMGISDTNIVGLRMFQLTTGTAKHPTAGGVPNNYYIPSPVSDPQFCNDATGICNFSIPAIYTENQYVANGDYVINSKNTFTAKYFYTHNPYTTYLGQGGGNLPGTPEGVLFGNHAAVAKLTTLVTNTFVNEARVSFQQNVNAATVAVPPGGCPDEDNLPKPYGCGSPNELGMQSEVPNFYEPESFLNVGTGYSMFGGLLPDKGPTNQLQAADQISWSHGKHSIRAGYEYEWTNWPLADPGLQQGLMLILGANAFLGDASNATGLFDLGCLFCVKSTSGAPNTAGVLHFYQLNNQNTYVLDDWKVSSRLTINVGLRWEYDGQLTDKYGHLTQVWLDRTASNAEIAACTTPPPTSPECAAAGVQQYVVPSNFMNAGYGLPPAGVGFARNKNTLEGHAPYTNFAPRLGFAWQPLSNGKLVIRAGAGIFYDRIGLDRVVHAFEQGYPYAETYDFGSGSPRYYGSSLAVPFAPVALVCVPNDPSCNPPAGQVGNGLGFAPRYADPSTANQSVNACFNPAPYGFFTPQCALTDGFQINSGLNTPLLPRAIHTPLVQEFTLGFQYEVAPQWVLELDYAGSRGINLTDYNHNQNGAQIITPATDIYGLCQPAGTDGSTTGLPICNTANNASFRVPVLGYEPIGLQQSDFNGSSNYNSLQATIRHQFGHGLSMQAAYTWDKNLSDIFYSNSANINDALALKTKPSPNGPAHGQWGPVSFDRFQRLVVNYSYDLPFGKGTEGIENKLINGWNVSGVTIAQTGNPLTFIGGGSGGAYGTNQQLIFEGVTTAETCSNFGNGQLKNGGGATSHVVGGATGYFNTAAFACQAPLVPFGDPGFGPPGPFQIPAATDYGNSGVGIVTGPGQFNWDISIVKNTQITEKVRMQFRSDFYNAFNHPQFAPPQGTNFGTVGFENVGNFGLPTGNFITATSVNPRLIQFGVHFFF
ncbi:MAG: carboxypeptidase regulatory-like domain-containing protein [Candidatus Acidiferrales bacterium]